MLEAGMGLEGAWPGLCNAALSHVAAPTAAPSLLSAAWHTLRTATQTRAIHCKACPSCHWQHQPGRLLRLQLP